MAPVAAGAVSGGRRGEYHRGEEGFDDRAKVRVNQQPGGDSHLSLSYADTAAVAAGAASGGRRGEYHRGEEGFDDRATVRVNQQPGGDSHLSLSHADTAAVAAGAARGGRRGEYHRGEEGFDDRATVRVNQQPSGDSHLSLSHADTAAVAAGAARGGRRGEYHQGEEGFDDRATVRVNQQPGGDSHLSLSHADTAAVAAGAASGGRRGEYHQGEEGFDDRATVRVNQQPGGDSHLSLSHADTAAVAAGAARGGRRGEYHQGEEGFDDRATVRVNQQPGGDSHLSLSHADTAAVAAGAASGGGGGDRRGEEGFDDRATVRVNQQPGGDSHLSLSHADTAAEAAGAVRGGRRGEYHRGEEGFDDRATVRVNQQPGGDSHLSLSHADTAAVAPVAAGAARGGRRGEYHRGEEGFDDRATVRVNQQPGGDSHLSLSHADTAAVAAGAASGGGRGEYHRGEEGFDDRATVRVNQQPGGDSHLSLSHADTAAEAAGAASEGGGRGGRGRRGGEGGEEEEEEEEEDHRGEEGFDDRAAMRVNHEERTKDVSPFCGAVGLERIGHAIVKVDVEHFGEEVQVRQALSELSNALLLLGAQNGTISHQSEPFRSVGREESVAVPDSAAATFVCDTAPQLDSHLVLRKILKGGKFSTSNAEDSLFSVVMRSLGSAVLVQCRALNVAALRVLLSDAGGLLAHLNVVNALTMVSPSSNFLVAMADSIASRRVSSFMRLRAAAGAAAASSVTSITRATRTSSELGDKGATNTTREMALGEDGCVFWNSINVSAGFSAALASSVCSSNDVLISYARAHARFLVTPLPDAAEGSSSADPGSRLEGGRWDPFFPQHESLFSAEGLRGLRVEYDAPWPVPALLSDTFLSRVCLITRRFLELAQLTALFREVWISMRQRRAVQTQRRDRLVQRQGSRPTKSSSLKGSIGHSSRSSDIGISRSSSSAQLQSGAEKRAERLCCEALRVTQQAVQALFDFLADRVVASQQRLHHLLLHASQHGLDWVVTALLDYSADLSRAALQLSDEERNHLRRQQQQQQEQQEQQEEQDKGGKAEMEMAPELLIKMHIDCMLEACRQVLRLAHRRGMSPQLLAAPEPVDGGGGVDGGWSIDSCEADESKEAFERDLCEQLAAVGKHRRAVISATNRAINNSNRRNLETLILCFET